MVNYLSTFKSENSSSQVYNSSPISFSGDTRGVSISALIGDASYVRDEHLKALTMLALSKETPSENYLPVVSDETLQHKWDDVFTVQADQVSYDPTGVWQIADSIVHRLHVDGKEKYAVDGFIIPKLAIGEHGRMELKASLTQILKRQSGLRSQTNALSTLKAASIGQLLVMAKCCGIWDKALRLSSWYTSKRKSI